MEIQLTGGRTSFRPSEKVAGRFAWDLERAPKGLELRLFWRTEGKGTQDVVIAASDPIELPHFQGTREFELSLPASPYSFSGKPTSLVWAIEAVATPGKEHARVDFVMAPGGQEVDLREKT